MKSDRKSLFSVDRNAVGKLRRCSVWLPVHVPILALVPCDFCLFVCRLHLVTWNVGTAFPPPDVTSLLQLNSLGPAMDMYVIG